MANQENKELVRQFYDRLNQGDVAAIDQYVSADFIEHEESLPGIPPGREGVKAFFSVMRGAFPDMQVTIEDMVAEGDRVAVRGTWRGTHEAEFLDVPATGRQVVFSGIDIIRFEAGLAVEHWGVTDTLGLMGQLGAIAPPGT